MNLKVERLDGLRHLRIPAGQEYKSPGIVYVEGDASSASYWLAGDRPSLGVGITAVCRTSVVNHHVMVLRSHLRTAQVRPLPAALSRWRAVVQTVCKGMCALPASCSKWGQRSLGSQILSPSQVLVISERIAVPSMLANDSTMAISSALHGVVRWRLLCAGPERGSLQGGDFDCLDIPDAAMTLAVVAAFANSSVRIRNVESWRYKETERMEAIVKELGKLGVKVRLLL